jgi:tRNA dimethylallyltransferase
MAEITARGKIPLLVGGTMLYFKALQGGLSQLPEADPNVRQKLDAQAAKIGWAGMHGKLAEIDPESAARLEPADAQRVQRALEIYEISGKTMTELHQSSMSDKLPYQLLKIALIPSDRTVLHDRIAIRFDDMLKQGFVDEVKRLLLKYPSLNVDTPSMRCVGYRQALEHLAGNYDVAELRDRGIFATRQLAKRQLTWLRGMDDTFEVDCLNPKMFELALNEINQLIK